MPALRARARATGRRIKFVEVDLRWGVTAHEAAEGGTEAVVRCLEQVATADVLLGFVGTRHGWTPDNRMVGELLEKNVAFQPAIPPEESDDAEAANTPV